MKKSKIKSTTYKKNIYLCGVFEAKILFYL